LSVTGIDISSSSIEYARAAAHHERLNIEYRIESYLDLEYEALYDLALLIYGDYCALSRPDDSASWCV